MMSTLTRYEKVIQEHIALYVYYVKTNKLGVFDDVILIENTMFPNKHLYYIHHYSRSGTNTEYTVLPDAGEVLHSGGTFKVWFTKADDRVGIKSLLDAIDIYTADKIKNASDIITKMQNQQDLAHRALDFMM